MTALTVIAFAGDGSEPAGQHEVYSRSAHLRLYIIEWSDQTVKIGITSDLKKRAQALRDVRRNLGLSDVTIRLAISIPHINARKNESVLLSKFDRIYGEYVTSAFNDVVLAASRLDFRTVYTSSEDAQIKSQETAWRELFPALAGAIKEVPDAEDTMSIVQKLKIVTEARETHGVRAAGRLWFALGLPVVPEMREGDRQSSFGFTYTAVPTDDGRRNG